jgi:hypothetical protein
MPDKESGPLVKTHLATFYVLVRGATRESFVPKRRMQASRLKDEDAGSLNDVRPQFAAVLIKERSDAPNSYFELSIRGSPLAFG